MIYRQKTLGADIHIHIRTDIHTGRQDRQNLTLLTTSLLSSQLETGNFRNSCLPFKYIAVQHAETTFKVELHTMMGPMSKVLSLSRRKEYHLGYSSAALRPCGAHLSMRPRDPVHIHVRLKGRNNS